MKHLSQKEKILNRLQELDAAAKRSLGQNFLIDENIIHKIVDKAHDFKPSHIVEVGPGLGSLTEYLKAPQVTLIELDKKFAKHWSEQGFEVIEADALKWDWSKFKEQDFVLVSNLPYQISARLVVEISLSGGPKAMVLMFQKEVADRIMSPAGSKDYGYLSVIAQSFWKVGRLCHVSPHCFHPRPNVDSSVLVFHALEQNLHQATDPSIEAAHFKNPLAFADLVKNSFMQRRKKLIPKLKKRHPNVLWVEEFQKLGFNDNVRAEELSVADFHRLFECLIK